MAFTSLGVVLVSTLTFVLGTFPEFQSEEESGLPEEFPQAVFAMEIIDNILVGFFVIEYAVSINRMYFVKYILHVHYVHVSLKKVYVVTSLKRRRYQTETFRPLTMQLISFVDGFTLFRRKSSKQPLLCCFHKLFK